MSLRVYGDQNELCSFGVNTLAHQTSVYASYYNDSSTRGSAY